MVGESIWEFDGKEGNKETLVEVTLKMEFSVSEVLNTSILSIACLEGYLFFHYAVPKSEALLDIL